jgi:hydroxyethylthiazole kinase
MSPRAPTTLDAAALWRDACSVRENCPLVHNVTNLVVMQFSANMLLSLGASPVMAHAEEEVEDMAALAGALVLNIGTLSPPWVRAMRLAARRARADATPVVLDPVGAGATPYRQRALAELFSDGYPDIVRGNASEIMSVAGQAASTRGVDSSAGADDALPAARALAGQTGGVVCISGAQDHVVCAEGRHAVLANGHPWMTRVTGVGCSASALVAAFAAVQPDRWRATVAAMAYLGVAGEWAAERSLHAGVGLGSFQVALLDAVHLLGQDTFERRLRLSLPR